MKLLITGCGRSGTMWMSRVLQAQGLDVGHEKMGRDGIASWCLAAGDDIRLPDWHEPVAIDPGERWLRIHQVRHPLDVIASWAFTVPDDVTAWALHQASSLVSGHKIRDAMNYWCEWNALAATRAALTIRVEDIRSRHPIVNARRHDKLSASEICAVDPTLFRRVQSMAKGYGYDI